MIDKEPTAAELEPDMEAIVVSHETVGGANAINQARSKRGFAPLHVVVVPLVGASRGEAGGGKLSSSELRAADSAAGECQ